MRYAVSVGVDCQHVIDAKKQRETVACLHFGGEPFERMWCQMATRDSGSPQHAGVRTNAASVRRSILMAR